MTTDQKPEAQAVAWADDRAIQGLVGNCASAAAKAHWERSHWRDRLIAEKLKHPLFTQTQLDAAIAEAVAAERERERKRPGEARLRVEAERWRALCARLRRANPMLGRWKVIEVSATFGDETEIPDLEKAVDEYAAAIRTAQERT